MWFGPWRRRAGCPIVTLEELVGEDQRALRPPREQAVPPADGWVDMGRNVDIIEYICVDMCRYEINCPTCTAARRAVEGAGQLRGGGAAWRGRGRAVRPAHTGPGGVRV